ncbi:hypothetical protein AcV5_007047 [Taiwanofungus camphoratus]|nr:hypothetical protein AcV5_007047 [Antrodia cinnamomea]KAI0958795.1 hypothetical protein AcV7_004505 [Antrodia cinnamomea]
MSSQVSNGSGAAERDMTIHQRGLVDTCFEEGQYESGIAVLDQLRSPKYRPFAPHIRQLLYIALYPPSTAADEKETETTRLGTGSPSELLMREQRSSLAPLPTATEAALNLLTAFAHTNTPKSLFRALPSYSCSGTKGSGTNHVHDAGDDEDSYIAKQAIRIKNAKDCWSILKEGFVQRKHDFVTTPKAKGKKGRRRTVAEEDDRPDSLDMNGETPGPVGRRAWPVLDWIVRLLEKDEKMSEESGQPRHSPLLLSQIPPPRTSTGARWDVETPLDIIFYSLRQQDLRHRTTGARLFALLINLSWTVLLDFPMFSSAISSRIASLSSDDIAALFVMLPPSQAIMQFKLALCKNYLGGFINGSVNDGIRPRHQVRAQPRPVAARRRPTETSIDDGAVIKASSAEVNSASIARKYPTTTSAEVLVLIKSSSTSDPLADAQVLRLKLELATAYWVLQQQVAGEDRDSEWLVVIRDGRLKEAFEAAFASQGDGTRSEIESLVESIKQVLAMMSVC